MYNYTQLKEDSSLSDEAIAKIGGVADFTEQAFKVFGCELVDVAIQFDKSLIGPVFDKFGKDVQMMPVNDIICATMVHALISPTFFDWLAQFGSKMQILSPNHVATQFRDHISEIVYQSGGQ